jgi:HSP20 family molecular chaperone IbpA
MFELVPSGTLLSDLRREMRRSFGLPAPHSWWFVSRTPQGVKVDASDDDLTLSVELPGFSSEMISVDVLGSKVTITSQRSSEHRSEHRSLTWDLGFEPDPSQVSASMENGLLKVKVPRSSQLAPSKVRVPISESPAPHAVSASSQLQNSEDQAAVPDPDPDLGVSDD